MQTPGGALRSLADIGCGLLLAFVLGGCSAPPGTLVQEVSSETNDLRVEIRASTNPDSDFVYQVTNLSEDCRSFDVVALPLRSRVFLDGVLSLSGADYQPPFADEVSQMSVVNLPAEKSFSSGVNLREIFNVRDLSGRAASMTLRAHSCDLHAVDAMESVVTVDFAFR